MVLPPATSRIAIWERVIHCDGGVLPPEAARFFLNLAFDRDDLDQMHALAIKNAEGSLAPDEQEALRNYRQIGLQLDLLRSKARQAIQPGPLS
jgi:hypothetical protein